MSLDAELLLAVTGVFPRRAITIEDARAAEGAFMTWGGRLRRWVGNDEQAPFELPKDRDLTKTLDQLAHKLTPQEMAAVTENLTDAGMEADYQLALLGARKYLLDRWPATNVDTAAGPRPMPLPQDEADEVLSLVAVVDDPDRVIDEVEMQSLTPSQAEAFRAVYPALSQALLAGLRVAIIQKGPKWAPSPDREDVFRTLAGLEPEAAIITPEQQESPPAQAGPLKLEQSIKGTQTQAQQTEAPLNGNP